MPTSPRQPLWRLRRNLRTTAHEKIRLRKLRLRNLLKELDMQSDPVTDRVRTMCLRSNQC